VGLRTTRTHGTETHSFRKKRGGGGELPMTKIQSEKQKRQNNLLCVVNETWAWFVFGRVSIVEKGGGKCLEVRGWTRPFGRGSVSKNS